jgi:hypothetical protein
VFGKPPCRPDLYWSLCIRPTGNRCYVIGRRAAAYEHVQDANRRSSDNAKAGDAQHGCKGPTGRTDVGRFVDINRNFGFLCGHHHRRRGLNRCVGLERKRIERVLTIPAFDDQPLAMFVLVHGLPAERILE